MVRQQTRSADTYTQETLVNFSPDMSGQTATRNTKYNELASFPGLPWLQFLIASNLQQSKNLSRGRPGKKATMNYDKARHRGEGEQRN